MWLLAVGLFLPFLLTSVRAQGAWRPCAPLKVNGESINCVCNITYCDDFPMFASIPANSAVIYTSSMNGKRFLQSAATFGNQQLPSGTVTVVVNVTHQQQTINGFGGAFTDAATLMIARLSKQTRLNVLRSYYADVGGIGYNMGRVPLASCDFSTREYTYDDADGDFQLTNFSLADEDTSYKVQTILFRGMRQIPSILDAQSLTSTKIWLFASPWTPPAWMKTNDNDVRGQLIDNATVRQTYANYYVKFFQAYKDKGVDFWGLTVQNEPLEGNGFQSMKFDAVDEANFVVNQLGPVLKANDLTKNIQLMIFDDSRIYLPLQALNVSGASNFVDGMAIHWYSDGVSLPLVLTETHNLFPSKFLLYTEACNGVAGGVTLGSWEFGENYARSITHPFPGGPNWVNNYNDAPMIVNFETDSFQKQPMFYVLGHYTKLITRGSIWVEAQSPNELPFGVYLTAFIDPSQNNRRVIVISNQSPELHTFAIQDVNDPKSQSLLVDVEERSIVTIAYNAF